MASIIKQHGKFYLQFFHKDRKPQRKRVALKTTTKRDAEAVRSKLEHDYLIGKFDPWKYDPFTYDRQIATREPKTLSEAKTLFLKRKEDEGRSENTINSYRWIVGLFAERVGPDLLLEDLIESHFESFLRDPSVSKGTRHARYRHVRAFIRWCASEGLLEANPMEPVEAPERPQKLPKAMTYYELLRILVALRQAYRAKLRDGHCREGEIVWMLPMFAFAYFTGLRASELARLRWKHIDCEKRLIYILKQKNKKEQTVPPHGQGQGRTGEDPQG